MTNKWKKLAGKVGSTTKKTIDKSIEGTSKIIKSATSGKAVSKKVLKKNKMGVRISEFKAPSILGDDNRFFKGEVTAEKRNMFFE